MSDFFKNMVREIDDANTHMADEGVHSAEYSGTIDTGSYILNALLCGSIYGGVPDNKIIAFAGESATGKTFFVLGLIKKFLDDNPTGGCIYYDTEAAVTLSMMKERGIDTKRIIISEQSTVETFRTNVSRTLDKYMANPPSTRPPLLMVLDSLGQLSTEKESGDIAEGKNARDMTRAQLIRGTFRALSLKLARAKVALVVTNHVSSLIGAYVPTKVMGGGDGLRYAASQIIFLSKKKDKDGNDVVGNIIHCKTDKSRFTKENKMVDVRLSYDKGLDKYYGLLELAEKYGIIKKVSTRYELKDGRKLFEKAILKDPESVFTKSLLDELDAAAKAEFCYGQGETPIEDEEVSDVEAA